MPNWFKKIKRTVALNLPAFHGQALPKEEILNVFKKPLENFEKLSEKAKWRNRQTQIKKNDDPIKLIQKTGQWYFGKLKDKTLGFVHESEMIKVKAKNWQLQAEVKKISLEEAIKKYHQVPYLLGGTTEQGIDCSGLTQRIYREVYGIELPKHSKDQARKGRKVLNLNKLKVGDLVFFSSLDNDAIKHVGLVLEAEKKEILHASEKVGNKVLIENLKDMMRRYRVSGVRRILKGLM
ncbi:MAG: NLP/P60 family lipoprotein, lipoprotein Spr [Candidatus Peregrinibacteria bacterium GW2011_GWF2_33_10]|nr:MAG: NLP/P60 family lipoprotein, lipoprotein Spr [Candidatus Peregrinibacteria bacterium GW2011_GWF2_33_10]OGJ45182.1 MAG: hypothetical protein A2263_03845 [Candidatus Peregrinibacteria bacterium RIFOXYA2_FULL_33_21]OGJ46003.1 MAG: hypothetical protein A2272_03745 [Candidatus Peregrinibacteria bacterium RIFOXYA12_FULL_33_12]OGJ50892.1 MAG: hypothetical protein A2307_01660 [Candidatus Peregrinibacteria bacterium RIFOXYB2_FULL_33_20]